MSGATPRPPPSLAELSEAFNREQAGIERMRQLKVTRERMATALSIAWKIGAGIAAAEVASQLEPGSTEALAALAGLDVATALGAEIIRREIGGGV